MAPCAAYSKILDPFAGAPSWKIPFPAIKSSTSPIPSVTDMQNTILLMHFNGINNGTVFTDSSPMNQTFNTFGNPLLTSKIQSKFNTTSAYFPGGSYIQSATNINNNLGSGNFTIEFWLNWSGVNQNPGYPQTIISNNNSSL